MPVARAGAVRRRSRGSHTAGGASSPAGKKQGMRAYAGGVTLADGNNLRFGDIVALFTSVPPCKDILVGSDDVRRGFLCSEGTVNAECGLADIPDATEYGPLAGLAYHEMPPANFRECLFQVCPMLQYTAQSELEERVEESGRSARGQPANPIDKKQLRRLQRAAEKEDRLNALEMQRRMGAGVFYGQNIQLKHIKSGKFLMLFPREVATIESSALKVRLSPKGSLKSCLNVLPRFKVRKLDDAVEVMDHVLLGFRNRVGEVQYAAVRPLLRARCCRPLLSPATALAAARCQG